MTFGPWLIGLIVLSFPLFLSWDEKAKYGYVGLILFSIAIFHVSQIQAATNAIQASFKSGK
jgi:hypothetical protein